MPLRNPTQQSKGGTFTQIGDQPLSKKVRGVRLPLDIDAAIERMPEADRASWLRGVIVAAARAELLNEKIASEKAHSQYQTPSSEPTPDRPATICVQSLE